MKRDVKPPTSFWVVGFFALLWNVIEIYISTYEITFLQENLTIEEFKVMQSLPYWYIILFLVAIISEILGSFMLLIRKKLATLLYGLSLIALIIIELCWILVFDIKKTSLFMSFVLPVLVISVAILLYVYSKRAANKGWIR
ncbi:hypothetical protein [Altibacter sp.]|uniref:hypothetical protein n=1 Tax=Altibacter sp. TaxID=2024823 RepID=UPI000C92907C|nr:hypothetical protein [Altibacter sp.]MAP54063.1 hypothetical protein [Altibacter sp.]